MHHDEDYPVEWRKVVGELNEAGIVFPRLQPPEGAVVVSWDNKTTAPWETLKSVRGRLWTWRNRRTLRRERVVLIKKDGTLCVGAWTHPDVLKRWPSKFTKESQCLQPS